MAGNGHDGGVGDQFVGYRCAAFGGAAVIFGDQFELEAFDIAGIFQGDQQRPARCRCRTGVLSPVSGGAHADLNRGRRR